MSNEQKKNGIISAAKNQIAKAKNVSMEDIASFMVGNDKIETLGTGAAIAGGGITGYGLIAGDHEATATGLIVGGAGLLARGLRMGYRAYKALGGRPASGDPCNQTEIVEQPAAPNISKEAAEDQLRFVDLAKGTDAQVEVIRKSAIELGLNEARWTQLSAKWKDGKLNKPEVQLVNAICKHAEMMCNAS